MLKRINVFVGGSSDISISQNYADVALELGRKFNERDYNIVFDGCYGLPFLAFSEINDSTNSIILRTDYYNNNYIYNTGGLLCRYRNQSEFTSHILKESDAFIFMKGKIATLSEIMYVINSKKNKEHDKPIVILNVNHEWDDLCSLLNTLEIDSIYYITDSVIDALKYMEERLFDKNSSFYKLYVNPSCYLGRSVPIIEEEFSKKNPLL